MKTTKKTNTKQQKDKKESEALSDKPDEWKLEEFPLFSVSMDWMGKRISNVDSFFRRYRKVDD
jgi:hypothetical protein